MRFAMCLCEEARICRESIDVKTRIVVLMHHREEMLTTNTAKLATLVIPSAEIRVRGLPGAPMSDEGILDDRSQALLLFPHDDAITLSPEYVRSVNKPITLIVPDGSWRQAFKVAKREPILKNVPRVKLPPGPLSKYQLRSEPKPEGLATFEAIARTLGIIEGADIQSHLESLFDVMVRRTLLSRQGILHHNDP